LNNPGGRLPVTFYKSLDDLPPFADYSMQNRTYRYFKGKALYSFGYGLSYTKFSYSHLKLSTGTLHAGDMLIAEADVRNTGREAGDEVAELYLMPPTTATAASRRTCNWKAFSASTSRRDRSGTLSSGWIRDSSPRWMRTAFARAARQL